ncbi:MAG TPA: NAD-dependent epimerase/dehydratase family protein [Pedobacter sp.]
MKTALLTGASGFLGKIIYSHLRTSMVIKTAGRHPKSDFKWDLSSGEFDLKGEFDLVIHSAGKAHSSPSTEEERDDFFRINVTGTTNLLKSLQRLDRLPQSFVFISTIAVYGLDKGSEVDESHQLNATDPYGSSKIKAERLIQNWCTKHNIQYTILRLPLIAGPNPPGNLGAMISAIKKGYYLNISGGMARKSVVLADDVASIVLKAAKYGGVYNLTDGCHPSFIELSELIAKQLKKNNPNNIPNWLAKLMAKAGDIVGSQAPINSDKLKKITSDLTFDDTKARNVLGWNPTPVLERFRVS